MLICPSLDTFNAHKTINTFEIKHHGFILKLKHRMQWIGTHYIVFLRQRVDQDTTRGLRMSKMGHQRAKLDHLGAANKKTRHPRKNSP